eukprot:CAMPEP_0178431568 /NCGR_PEP_ID=MMETSP0689_2-20121128/31921_1 /TAXON_ID=160604 /ORGANISM="Amphidinium massartii, Strain CS-259" /LENGTH=758 /DNA_ID=CAMNT_0020053497 /DNA_START=61 /DNA_END=2333 /DNA_ORIENTATION=-
MKVQKQRVEAAASETDSTCATPPPPPPPVDDFQRLNTHRRSLSSGSQSQSSEMSSLLSMKSSFSRQGGCPGCHKHTDRFDERSFAAAGLAAARLKSSEKWGPRCKAARELSRLGCAAARYARLLVGALRKDPHPAVRCAAGEALAALGGYTGVRLLLPDIVAALKDPEEKVRVAAAEALGAVGERDAVTALQQASKEDPQEVVRRAASKALGVVRMGSKGGVATACDFHGDLPPRAPVLQREPSLRKGEGELTKEVKESPELWGVRVSQLIAFEQEIMDETNPDNLVDYCRAHEYFLQDTTCVHVCLKDKCPYGDHRGVPHVTKAEVSSDTELHQMIPNMHAVVQREIKPRTRESACSAALMMNPSGLRINAYTTHAWDEEFSRFVQTLNMALDPDDIVWVCSFALDQNSDIGEILNVDLDDCPFAQALQCAEKHVVIVDSDLRLIERAWCLYEIAKSSQCAIPLFLWTCQISDIEELGRRVASIDVRNASATFQKDLDMVQHGIEKGIGHDAMNVRLRTYIGDRVRFYQAAVNRCEGQLCELSRQIACNQARDGAAMESLSAQLRDKLRLMQEEAHHRAEREAEHRGQVDELQKRIHEMEEARDEASSHELKHRRIASEDHDLAIKLEKELAMERRTAALLKTELDGMRKSRSSSLASTSNKAAADASPDHTQVFDTAAADSGGPPQAPHGRCPPPSPSPPSLRTCCSCARAAGSNREGSFRHSAEQCPTLCRWANVTTCAPSQNIFARLTVNWPLA